LLLSCGSSKTIDPDRIRRACVMAQACLFTASSVANCVDGWERGLLRDAHYPGAPVNDFGRYIDCGATATSCDGFFQCISTGHGTDWCNANYQGACDGNIYVACVNELGLAQEDCGAYGMQCVQVSAITAACGTGRTCSISSATHCEGNHLISCDTSTNQETSVDCTVEFPGGTCSGTSCLAPPSPLCTADNTSVCDGDVVVICQNHGAIRADCTQIQSHCVVDATSGQAVCVPIATACTVLTPDTCIGTSLQACVNGVETLTDCKSLGFTGCQSARCGG
jgi:hypothetical protein